MVEGSPRRVTVAAQDSKIKTSLDLADDEEKHLKLHQQHESIRKTESDPSGGRPYSPGGSRWKKLRTTVQLSNAVSHHRKAPLKREDSFLKRFSTRPPNIISSDKDSKNAQNFANRLARATVLNPDESLLFWWLWLVTFCGLHNSWTLIVRQAFPELQEAHLVLWSTLDWCSDCIYLLDIAVQFRTGYLEQGIMVRDGKRLARHYVTSRDFFLDVAALVPLSFMHRLIGESPLLRFPRFLKARRIYKFYYAVESRTAYPNLWRVANLIHVLLLLAHWFGCFYYMLSELEGFQGNWAYKHPENEYSPLIRKYLGSVYWSTLTLTTIGDLATPATNLQYLFTIISYLIGVFIFATIVGQVGNVITNRNASRLEFERLLDGAKLYMRHHKVPKGMQRRVQRWYDYSWSRGRMQGGGDIHSALGILPDKLKTELAIHVNLKTLKKVSIFQECQPEFLHDLVLKMKAYIFTPGDLVCRKGEVAREMFIIADGILQVINEKGQVLTQMRAGDFFGEIGILNLDGFNRRTADVRSVGYSELFSLSREDVLSAMKDYPEAEEILQSMGRKRLMEARMASPSDTAPPFQENSERPDTRRGKDNRQRKKGMSLAYLLGRKDMDHDKVHKHKYSNLSNSSDAPGDSTSSPHREPVQNQQLQNSFIKSNHIVSENQKQKNPNDETTSKATSLVEQITAKLRKRNNKIPRFSVRKKRTLWCKISRLVTPKRSRGSSTSKHPDAQESAEDFNQKTKANSCDVLLRPDTLGLTNRKRSIVTTQTSAKICETRRTSWQPSKPSVSNWNRSELFTLSSAKAAEEVRTRRKTLTDGTLLKTNFKQDKLAACQPKVPGVLLTGSGLNTRSVSPDISPMSSNYSLTPSTTDDEGNPEDVADTKKTVMPSKVEDSEQVPNVPTLSASMQDFLSKIAQDFKATMDTYIAETEKDLCLRILELEEEIKQKDSTIRDLQLQCAQEVSEETIAVDDVPAEEEQQIDSPKPSPLLGHSQDSAVCSIDCASPEDLEPENFEEEDLWLVEFPQNIPVPLAVVEGKRARLRRHSSVEVGNELPFRLATQKPPSLFLRSTADSEILKSPRRFSESQARPDVVALNNTFAARVRRVFAKVKASKAQEDQSIPGTSSLQGTFKWPLLSTKAESKSGGRRSSTGSTNDRQVRLPFLFQQRSTPSTSKRHQKSREQDDGDDSDEISRLGSDDRPVIKRFLPTITESCSFDSLRESPLLTQASPPPVSSMPNLDEKGMATSSVVIDMTAADDEVCT